MLETGCYVGIRDPMLIAAAGVHAYSPAERVAALGTSAIRCYTRLGFVPNAPYDECVVTTRDGSA